MTAAATPDHEQVVLVDNRNQPVGVAAKRDIHHDATPLHRGFSIFLFRRPGELLLQQRSAHKKTWPGVWSNSCCGHPGINESTVDAMQRRVLQELGIPGIEPEIVLPGYRYRFQRDGIVENEFCPVGIAIVDEVPDPDPDEVQATRWISWELFMDEVRGDGGYSEWCIEEAHLLDRHPDFQAFLGRLR